ncbi:hypothetical protein GGI35DRAFT_234398 [Trichoderma velutinum]
MFLPFKGSAHETLHTIITLTETGSKDSGRQCSPSHDHLLVVSGAHPVSQSPASHWCRLALGGLTLHVEALPHRIRPPNFQWSGALWGRVFSAVSHCCARPIPADVTRGFGLGNHPFCLYCNFFGRQDSIPLYATAILLLLFSPDTLCHLEASGRRRLGRSDGKAAPPCSASAFMESFGDDSIFR